VLINATDPTPLRVTARDIVTSSVNVINDDRFDIVHVNNIEGGLTSENTSAIYPLPPDFGSLAPLAVNQSTKVTFSGATPVRKLEDGPPEIYQLNVTLRAKAGYLRSSKPFQNSRRLEVWPAQIGRGEPSIGDGAGLNGSSPTGARVDILFYPGRAIPSASGDVRVTSAPDEISGIVTEDLAPVLVSPPAKGQVIHEVDFSLKSLEQFKFRKFTFNLRSSKPLTPERWKQIVHDMQVEAIPDQGG
jgi:hypothetical protein